MIPSPETLTRANAILHQIESLQSELASLFTGDTKPTGKRRGRPPGSGKVSIPSTSAPVKGRRRTMSPEARAKIAAGQKARWAKFHAGQGR